MQAHAPGIARRSREALTIAHARKCDSGGFAQPRADESSPVGGSTDRRDRLRADCAAMFALRTRRAVIPASRTRRLVVIGCIAALAVGGAVAFGHGLYIHAKAWLAQVLLRAAWQEAQASGGDVKPWPWADTYPVARLSVPALGADVLVLAGASGRTLAFGPGHLDGSARPGDSGNAIVTAHRDTHFRFLRAVGAGHEVVVERADGTQRRFRVRRSYVADYRALRLPRDADVPTLTLVTCFPFDAVDPGGPLRYVVVAEAT
jgi:sortase A